MKGLLAWALLSDGLNVYEYMPMLSSVLQSAAVKRVIYSVPEDLYTEEIKVLSNSQRCFCQ